MGESTHSLDGPICPHCGREYTPDEPFYYDDSNGEMDCDSCGAVFNMEIYHSTSWTCTPKDDSSPTREGGE